MYQLPLVANINAPQAADERSAVHFWMMNKPYEADYHTVKYSLTDELKKKYCLENFDVGTWVRLWYPDNKSIHNMVGVIVGPPAHNYYKRNAWNIYEIRRPRGSKIYELAGYYLEPYEPTEVEKAYALSWILE